METYQSMYEGEIRALELEIDDDDGANFVPSGAFVQVLDDTGATVVAEQAALVVNNTVATLIGTTVTATPGEYKIIWRIIHSVHTYKHVTILEVQEL